MAACENGESVAQRMSQEEKFQSRRVSTTSARSRKLPARKSSTGIGQTSGTTSDAATSAGSGAFTGGLTASVVPAIVANATTPRLAATR